MVYFGAPTPVEELQSEVETAGFKCKNCSPSKVRIA